MKKYFYAALALLVAMTASTALVACGDDDDEGNGIDSRIIGTWRSSISEGWEYENNVLVWHWKDLNEYTVRSYEIIDGKETGKYEDETLDEPEFEIVTFKADGTFEVSDEDEDVEYGTYTTANGNIIFIIPGEGPEAGTYQFKNNQLLIKFVDEDDEWREEEVSYFDRVK